jgi:peptidoglycan pentaglycine glycine transferase (the first glycine)
MRISTAAADPAWDAFLSTTDGGHHLQSSAWGRVKSGLGWRTVRLAALRDGRIHGGGQLLLRSVPAVGAVAYLPAGPLFARADQNLVDDVLRGLQQVCRRFRVRLALLQPPRQHADLVLPALAAHGFADVGDLVELYPTATLLVDVGRGEDEMLAGMRKSTRYKIRRAQRLGVTVRHDGGLDDVAVFHQMLALTGERQGFAVPAPEYFRSLLRTMGRQARLFVAEYEGVPVSGALVIAFGDRVSLKRAAWSGDHNAIRPNELLQWSVIRWARDNGFRLYDLEGIDRAVVADGRIDTTAAESVTSFKLGLGGRLALEPGAWQWTPSPLLRTPLQAVLRSVPGRRLVERIRTR